jgi:3-hydroxyisobutyrate dehydrogenase-like beta-hydroxyacid dehydrogenase
MSLSHIKTGSAEPSESAGGANIHASTFSGGVGVGALPPLDIDFKGAEKPTIAIMSVGEMGIGIAALLSKFRFPLVTNLDGRSEKTKARSEKVGMRSLPIVELIQETRVFLSIVPPAEALQLAQQIAEASKAAANTKRNIVYLDLNAISPDLSRQIGQVIRAADMTYIDGAIIGFPPREIDSETWFRPAITVSGPQLDGIAGVWTEQFVSLLNLRHVSEEIGGASGLKMCFGSMYKGQAAIAIQAYTTAQNLGVLPALRQHMAEYFPTSTPIIEGSILGSQKKAYRWIKEMEEIEDTFAKEGGWNRNLFNGITDVFRVVAHQTNLEKANRNNIEDVVGEVNIGLRRTKSN